MAQRKDGGPAFGHAGSEWSDGCWVDAPVQRGMTLRDYFAAKAMQVVYAEFWRGVAADEYTVTPGWRDGVAADAYQMADAMLAARERT